MKHEIDTVPLAAARVTLRSYVELIRIAATLFADPVVLAQGCVIIDGIV